MCLFQLLGTITYTTLEYFLKYGGIWFFFQVYICRILYCIHLVTTNSCELPSQYQHKKCIIDI